MITDLSLARLDSALSFWESAGYVAVLSVIACCFAEYLHVEKYWHRDGSVWTKSGGSIAALLLVVALACEMLTQFRTNAASGRIVAQQNADAAITEQRLLAERRLTANERWRLERVERAVLPRASYVNWQALVAAIHDGHFGPTNIAFVAKAEPSVFAMQLEVAFQAAKSAGRLMPLKTEQGMLQNSSGVMVVVVNANGDRLTQMLWEKFQIGGASVSAKVFSSMNPGFPIDNNCLIVGDNGWAMSGGDGQPGEGTDKWGGSDPAPH